MNNRQNNTFLSGNLFCPEQLENWNNALFMVRKETGEKRPQSRVLQVSNSCLSLFGYSRQEFEEQFQQNFYKLVHPDDRQHLRASLRKPPVSAGSFHVRYRVITKEHSELFLLENGLVCDDGSFFCVLAEATGQSVPCSWEEKAQQRLKALIQAIPGGVIYLHFNGKKFSLLDASESFYRLFGYRKEEYLNMARSSLGVSRAFVGEHQKMVHTINRWLLQGAAYPLAEEYRIQRKDGSFAWVAAQISVVCREENNWELQFLFNDSSMYRMIMQDLKKDQRHIMQESISGDVLFDYEVATDLLHMSNQYNKLRDHVSEIDGYSEKVVAEMLVHPADVPVFRHLIDGLQSDLKFSNTLLRFRHRDGKYYWYHLIGASITDDSGKIVRVVGKAINMNRQRQEMIELVERVQRDPFTRLYNKTMTETLVKQLLSREREKSHAMLIIDLDNFKEINDTFGHLHGDAVLVEFSRILRLKFEDKNIAGRIGGDEFLVFLQGEHRKEALREKAREVCRMFQQSESLASMHHLLSASVGIAITPDDGISYEELFHKADQALYVSKRTGKGNVIFYSEIPGIDSVMSTEEKNRRAVELTDDISLNYGADPHLIFEVTEELLASGGKSENMGPVLRMIGRVLSVGRVYLTECSRDHQQCTIACEWCAPSVDPAYDGPKRLSFETLDIHYRRFDEWGLFRCYDVNEIGEDSAFLKQVPSVHSTLHCALYDQRGMRGFIGCDDVTANRVWNQSETATLSVLCGLVSRFLFY